MARLILKSPYIKGGARAVNYAKYIGTRERVELVPDGRPATKKQEQLIAGLVKDFPDAKKLPEYRDYHNSPTKVNASAFITQALEDNCDGVQQSDIYAEYLATRPRVERLGSHGLFGDEDYVDLKKVTAELQNCEKNVWTHIVSLKREVMAESAPRTPQRYRCRHEHPAQRLPLVRCVPRRRGSSPRSHDGLVCRRCAGVSE